MSQHFRQDLITQQWVVCAPERSDRPKQFAGDDDVAHSGHDGPVEGCPFCPGNEEMLLEVVHQSDAPGDQPWRTRSVPNKYPALTPDGPPGEEVECMLYRERSGYGRQEVIILSPDHSRTFSQLPLSHVETVVDTYRQRYVALREAEGGLVPIVFHNHGSDAGASLPHPHSQIIAPSVRPPDIQSEEAQARSRFESTGRCPYCEMIDEERTAGARIVHENEDFVAFVPYAARAPYETWILPKRHEPEFARLTGSTRAFADAVRTSLVGLYRALDDPDYNFFVRTALEYASTADHLHWSLRIRPRVSTDAGFEIGTGMKINPSLPERDADVLRSAIIEPS